MRGFCCVLCGAFFLKLAGSSFSGSTPRVLTEPKLAKATLKADQLNSTKLKAPLDQLKAPLELNSTKDKLRALLNQMKALLVSHPAQNKALLDKLNTFLGQLKTPLEPNPTKDKLKASRDQLKASLESHPAKNKAPLESIPTSDPVGASGDGHNDHKFLGQKQRLPVLELMSLSLDDWGARSAHDRSEILPESIMVSGNANAEPFERGDANFEPFHASFQPFDQMLGSDGGDHLIPLAHVPKSMNMFDSRAQQAHPLNFVQYAHLALLAFLIVAYLMSCLCRGDLKGDKVAALGAKFGKRPWAEAYAGADCEEKVAFELLFGCNMISPAEFSHGAVSPEHIEDCTLIAKHMLQHKTLGEWVGLWQLSHRSFEVGVADVFEMRGGQVGLGARQRLTLSWLTPSSSTHTSSRPSSANLHFVSDAGLDLPLHS